MNAKSLIWIVLVQLIIRASAKSRDSLNPDRSSQMPTLLRRIVENYPTIMKSEVLLPDYEDVPPTPISSFENYDWYYVGSADPSSRKRKRQAVARRVICATTNRGVCIAKCGFGAPLDFISNNKFFGCRPNRRSHHRYQRI